MTLRQPEAPVTKANAGLNLVDISDLKSTLNGQADASTGEIVQEMKRIASLNDIELDKKGRPLKPLKAGEVLVVLDL